LLSPNEVSPTSRLGSRYHYDAVNKSEVRSGHLFCVSTILMRGGKASGGKVLAILRNRDEFGRYEIRVVGRVIEGKPVCQAFAAILGVQCKALLNFSIVVHLKSQLGGACCC
jgi:hypothetical protein